MKLRSRAIVFLFVVLTSVPIAYADVRLPAIFSEHVVLQQNKPINVWGWDTPGSEVQVSISVKAGDAGEVQKTQKEVTTADVKGLWQVALPAQKAGGPYHVEIKGSSTVTWDDVLVGEVWLCSGQSNMAMTVNRALNAEEEAAQSANMNLRMFTVARRPSEEPMENCQGQWQLSDPKTVPLFSATAYFFGRRLQQELGVPVGLINSSYGGTDVAAWTSVPVQKSDERLAPGLADWQSRIDAWDADAATERFQKQLQAWKNRDVKAKAAGQARPRRPRPPVDPRVDQNRPGNLFNGMIAPLIPYTIRGAIWYQGEHNARPERASLYGLQLSTLIEDWRNRFGQGDFPFYWVQLPNFRTPQQNPVENDGWVMVQEQMLHTLGVPNTGMAITTDVGEADDIHPKNKQAVGHRLAQWALAKTYERDIVPGGPRFASMTRDGSKVLLQFEDAGDGLKSADGKPLQGFAIAGADRKFVWAEAKVVEGGILVSGEGIDDPQSVRYNWAANPVGNLVNSIGFPASPFRTDDWKLE